ncbi:hypothetical protein L914_02340 [Phytophthora nicotianae]|uniref:Uncharacterized protein n=1 Tax=Phytophthora nicotianae TaxID=4792 RepID=W2P0I3_PHYNI|nr:hypothetical protein L914_02340 [Phytophthora nicotianae]
MWDSVIECEPEISAESLPVTGVGAIPAVVEPPVAAPKGEDVGLSTISSSEIEVSYGHLLMQWTVVK